ncbi:2-dehydropantoate 2-reductase [Sphingomonas sp. M1-B02]|uniref:2-dehydropantoate 2-reductase n=1 Tax=Sphingomonas sp. M1-B02 TaxID=3114300 RepID=UPI00223F0E91|nr:2-dehydropantoate 2-reductase [Sphingomonas sp. S6-11]UZK67443.1 2-dehydropantoate 2-reductase [Sphingomonas sp. S6-11]
MSRIAVIGAGAIGGTVAAWLAQKQEVILCARSPLVDLEVETPQGTIRATPRILTNPSDAEPVDWILAATKTYDSVSAAAWLPGLMGPKTRLAVLQNGVEHRERFAGIVANDRIVPAIVDIPAERSAPGRVLQRRTGTILVPEGAEDFVALFADTPIAASTTADFVTAAWRKLAINCAGVVNAITLRPAEVANDPAIADLIRGLVAECCAVGRSQGADMPDEVPESVVAQMRGSDSQSVNSLHADRLAGRPMELDARNGVIVRLGAQHGISTPLNRACAALLAAAV